MSFRKYAEYKESGVEWLGEVPEHWVIGKVKHVTENLDKYRVPLSSMERGNRQGIYPYYGASGIIDYIDDYLFDEDTILFGEDGANLLARSTPLAFLATGKYWVNNHAHVLKAKDGLNRFWVMVLENIDITPVVSGSAQPKLTSEALGNLAIVYPPSIEERRKIIAFLDKETANIDTLIDKQEQLITLLQEKRQAIISHAVTRGLDPSVKMKDSGIEWLREVPEHWEVKKLKHIVTKPLMYGANEAAIDDDRDQPRFVRITDIRNNGTLREETFRSLPWHLAKSYMLREGDVLLARSGATVGKSFIYSSGWGECCFAGYLIKASIDISKASPYWFYRYTESDYYWNWISSILIQATIQNVSAEKYNNFSLCIPPKQEQLKIISYLDKETAKIDTLIAKCETAIELLKERRTALISAAVTGKIDVRRAV